MKAIVMTLVAAGAALAVSPASAQWGGSGPYGPRHAADYGASRPGGCASGTCPTGGCRAGACDDGCAPGACEAGRCGPGCDGAACEGCADEVCPEGTCGDGHCGSAHVRPASANRPSPRRPVFDPAPTFGVGRRPVRPSGGYSPSPFMADRADRRNR